VLSIGTMIIDLGWPWMLIRCLLQKRCVFWSSLQKF